MNSFYHKIERSNCAEKKISLTRPEYFSLNDFNDFLSHFLKLWFFSVIVGYYVFVRNFPMKYGFNFAN